MQHICCICYLLQTDNIAKYIHSTAAFLQQPPFWYLCVYPGIVQLLKPHHHAKFGIDWIRNDIVMPFAANILKMQHICCICCKFGCFFRLKDFIYDFSLRGGWLYVNIITFLQEK